jgi:hypothetical protein
LLFKVKSRILAINHNHVEKIVMVIIDILIIVVVVVFIMASAYNTYLIKKDDLWHRLYRKENDYTQYLYKQLTEKEQIIKVLQDEINKNSASNKDS